MIEPTSSFGKALLTAWEKRSALTINIPWCTRARMDLQRINPVDYPVWDNFLLASGDSSFFHTSAWVKVIAESCGYQPVYFAQMENNRLSYLMPLMAIVSCLTGRRGVSLPFTDCCNPFGRDNSPQGRRWGPRSIMEGSLDGTISCGGPPRISLTGRLRRSPILPMMSTSSGRNRTLFRDWGKTIGGISEKRIEPA